MSNDKTLNELRRDIIAALALLVVVTIGGALVVALM